MAISPCFIRHNVIYMDSMVTLMVTIEANHEGPITGRNAPSRQFWGRMALGSMLQPIASSSGRPAIKPQPSNQAATSRRGPLAPGEHRREFIDLIYCLLLTCVCLGNRRLIGVSMDGILEKTTTLSRGVSSRAATPHSYPMPLSSG